MDISFHIFYLSFHQRFCHLFLLSALTDYNQIKSSKKTPITKEIPIANDVPTDIEGILNYVVSPGSIVCKSG